LFNASLPTDLTDSDINFTVRSTMSRNPVNCICDITGAKIQEKSEITSEKV
jgi:hypothetical protein